MGIEKKDGRPTPDIMFRRVMEHLLDGEIVVIDGRSYCISEDGQFCMMMENVTTMESNAYALDFSFGAIYQLITNMTEEEYFDHSLTHVISCDNMRSRYE